MTRFHPTNTFVLRGIDDTDNRLLAVDSTAGALKQSEDWGRTWSASKGVPTGTQAAFFQAAVRFGAYIYTVAKVTADSTMRVYRASPASGDTAFTWSASLLTMTTGATGFNALLAADSSYLYAWEYGDPSGGPKAYRTSDGSSWTTIYGPDSSIRHIHMIAPDPYNPGHLWMTAGDGTAKTIQKSTDSGDNWTVAVASSVYQGVQISFTSDYVWFASDSTTTTVWKLDRNTNTVTAAAANSHNNIRVPVPPGTATDTFYRSAYWGAVDPTSGIYYCVASDSSKAGTTEGIFYLPYVGGPLLLDSITDDNEAGHVRFGGGNVYFANSYLPLSEVAVLATAASVGSTAAAGASVGSVTAAAASATPLTIAAASAGSLTLTAASTGSLTLS